MSVQELGMVVYCTCNSNRQRMRCGEVEEQIIPTNTGHLRIRGRIWAVLPIEGPERYRV